MRNVSYFDNVDSDYTRCKDTRQLTEGHIFVVAGGPVSWQSKWQETVALSTVELEYMAFTCATAQALWIQRFFAEIGLPVITPINIFADNSGSISNSITDKQHRCTKHIDIKFYKEGGDCFQLHTICRQPSRPIHKSTATRHYTMYSRCPRPHLVWEGCTGPGGVLRGEPSQWPLHVMPILKYYTGRGPGDIYSTIPIYAPQLSNF